MNDEFEIKVVWSRKAIYELIQGYRKHPVLYEANNDNYNNRRKRFEALKDIKSELARKGRVVTIEDIKRKIHGLRTQYNFQMTKIRRSELNAAHPDDVYKPTLWFFKHMDFLRKDAISGRENEVIEGIQGDSDQTNVSKWSRDNEEWENIDLNHETSDCYDDVSVKREEIDILSKHSDDGHAESVDKQDKSDDDISAFVKLVEIEMRKINRSRELRNAKRIILNALMDAQDACDN